MRKLLLLTLLIMIALFSSSPNLKVKDPATWVEKPRYISEFNITVLFNWDSEFYEPYREIRDLSEFILRKIGHFITYAVLALLFYMNLNRLINLRFRLLLSWSLTIFVGLTDEINQFFIFGRDGRLMDVILNSTAALTMIIVIAVSLVLNKSLK